MTNPSPDLPQPQVEAESVDSDEFRKLLATLVEIVLGTEKYVRYPDARAALIAHIDSIITARVADLYTEEERREAWKDGYSTGFEAAKGLFSQAAPAKAEGWISAAIDTHKLRRLAGMDADMPGLVEHIKSLLEQNS